MKSNCVLIECSACKSEIAIGAKTCPKCGAQNKYLHESIKSLLANKDNFETSCDFEYTGHEITFFKGNAPLWQIHWHLSKIWGLFWVVFFLNYINWQRWIDPTAGVLINMLQYIIAFGLFFLGIAAVFIRMANAGKREPSLYYKIDFGVEPPHVTTNDEKYWAEIDGYFKKNTETKKAV